MSVTQTTVKVEQSSFHTKYRSTTTLSQPILVEDGLFIVEVSMMGRYFSAKNCPQSPPQAQGHKTLSASRKIYITKFIA